MSGMHRSKTWQRLVAVIRYLSYRGFRVNRLRWNTAPVGLLLLAFVGTVFLFCKTFVSLIPVQEAVINLNQLQAWTSSHNRTIGLAKFTATRHH